MADPTQIVADPDFLAASPQMKAAILTKHDPDFAAASPEMQTRIVEKYGPGQRTGLISGADQAPALSQTDARAATISNPPGVMDYVKAGVRQAAATVLPTAGLLGGAALGTAATGGNPVGGVGGAALGYAGGESANRVVGSYARALPMIFNGRSADAVPRLSHVTDEAKQVGSDLLTGATLDMLPPALLGVLRGGKNIVKGAMGLGEPTADTMAVRAAAQRQGIDLPAGVASGSTPVSAVESFPGRFPIGRQASQPTYDRLGLQSQRAAERVQQHPEMGPGSLEQAGLAVKREVSDIAGAQGNAPTELVDRFSQSLGQRPASRIEAGTTLRGPMRDAAPNQGLQGSQRAARAEADELYTAARGEAPPDATFIPTNANRVSAQIATLEQRLGALGNRSRGPAETIQGLSAVDAGGHTIDGVPMPQRLIQQYGLDQPTPIPLDLGIELAKRAKAMMRATTNDVEKAQLRTIANALSEDIGNLTPGLARAGQFYRDEVARDFAPKSFIRKLIDLEPGRIAETVLTAQPDKVAAIMRQTPPAQRPMVQRMVFDKLRERSIDRGTGEVDPAKFESALSAYGEDNLRTVFGNRLNDLNAMRQTIRQNFGQGFTRPGAPQGPGGANIGNAFEAPMGAQPENVVNLLTRGKVRSVEDFDALARTLSPETQRMVRASAYDQILRESFDPATQVFSPQRFLTAKARIPQEIWDRMLTADPAAAVKDLEMVYGQIIQHARAAGNPSQTSHGIGAMTQLGATLGLATNAAFGNEDPESFSKKVIGILSPLLAGKAVFSKTGQRMLTSQPSTPANPNSGIATLGKMLGVQLTGERR